MALKTSYTSANKVTHSALAVRYSLGGMTGEKLNGSQDLYEVHRYITKNYSFVGLDYETAIACRDAKADMLKRTFYLWRVVDGELEKDDSIQMVDSVEAVHEDGDMWRVDIQVNEDDVNYTTNPASDLSLLDWPLTGDYDE